MQQKKPMTSSKPQNSRLSDDEWNEMVALKNAINLHPASVHPDKMEKFTELLVRSWTISEEI